MTGIKLEIEGLQRSDVIIGGSFGASENFLDFLWGNFITPRADTVNQFLGRKALTDLFTEFHILAVPEVKLKQHELLECSIAYSSKVGFVEKSPHPCRFYYNFSHLITMSYYDISYLKARGGS